MEIRSDPIGSRGSVAVNLLSCWQTKYFNSLYESGFLVSEWPKSQQVLRIQLPRAELFYVLGNVGLQ
jgi:hypothetical protein